MELASTVAVVGEDVEPTTLVAAAENELNQAKAKAEVVEKDSKPSGTPLEAAASSSVVRTMSIVMVAHNEDLYLQRTLDSIWETTPTATLHEIILVDDGSTPRINDVLSEEYLAKVRLFRQDSRRGLVKSRMAGADHATGDVIMFLDAHIRPAENWTEPLLRGISENYRRVVVPLIPILHEDTWTISTTHVGVKMMFDWKFDFDWFDDDSNIVPCMSGGIYAISRRWWFESGEYDYEMRVWGAENIEQSIRIWLCGGEIQVARDSKIGHVFRTVFPYPVNVTEMTINVVRTVEMWLDDYKEAYYESRPGAKALRDPEIYGNLTSRVELRDRLQCKPFRWYVDHFKTVLESRGMIDDEGGWLSTPKKKLRGKSGN
eukprot:NODE_7986_length_1532_cov_8.426335.p1 GENE.NODE_7986_length_1532_cov_8.426335~~NODE_7986_length_1532_cov_8.426335.p1  ORF type:complete len:413 (+),score=117.66 NODE_7986_length_1532_cov_8.426335:120-1241(+)